MPARFFACAKRIVDSNPRAPVMRLSSDGDSILVVANWPQARQKSVDIELSRFTCLQSVR
jgi:hypothetical protein